MTTPEKRDATPEERERILRALESGGLQVPIGAVFPTLGPEQPDDWDLTGVTCTAAETDSKDPETGEYTGEPEYTYVDFAWQTKRRGFGHITFRRSHADGTWRVDTEDMSREFVIDVFTHWLIHTLPDIRPRINPDPHPIK